jgi:CMP/dCMP kinase
MTPHDSPPLLITIDGPSGAGKSTVSRMLAEKLGYIYVDTGALYRGVAYEAAAAGVASGDSEGMERVCRGLFLRFSRTDEGLRLFSGEADITDRIRTPSISMLASAVSALPVVRDHLLALQRRLGRDKRAVFEGRDMGTVVFPEADVKFFLYADPDARAMRRFRELGEKAGEGLEEVKAEMSRRDENDQKRAIAPLRPAENAIPIDSTHLSAHEVVDLMVGHIERRRTLPNRPGIK